MPTNLTAANGVWMKFRSDDSSTGVGFLGQFTPGMGLVFYKTDYGTLLSFC